MNQFLHEFISILYQIYNFEDKIFAIVNDTLSSLFEGKKSNSYLLNIWKRIIKNIYLLP